MRQAAERIRGRIVGYDEKRRELLIRAPWDDVFTMTKRDFRDCLVQPIDSRPLSDRQRKACYALLREISAHCGLRAATTKDYMKLKFMAEELEESAQEIFSLADAPMSLVCAFQRFLVRFILEKDIDCSFPLLEFVEDVSDYIYACLLHKKCCVCGRKAGLYPDAAGTEPVLPLCREHALEATDCGREAFENKYHLTPGVQPDNTLRRIYGLHRGRITKEERN